MLRQILDLFIYLARHMVFTFALALLVAWWFGRRRGIRTERAPSGFQGTVAGVSLALVATFGAIGAWYLGMGGFAGEVEPMVSCLSWLVQSGRPLYTELEAAERYSVLYGPSVFLTNGLFLKMLGPSLMSAKLASILATFGSLIFLYAAVAQRSRDLVALATAGLAVLYFWTQGFAVYLVRPDALLLFAVSLALYAVVHGRRWLALLTVAVMAGFAVNLKVHSLLYILPVLVLQAGRFGRRALAVTLLGMLVVVAAPFLLYPQVSLGNYLAWLDNGLSHGLETETLGLILQYAGFLLIPLAAAVWVVPRRGDFVARHRAYLWTLSVAYAAVGVLAAKPGAGPVHLLPLVPTTMWLLAQAAREIFSERPLAAAPGVVWRQAVIGATLATALLSGSVNAYRAVRYVDYQIRQTPDLVQDVQGIMAAHPGLSLSMACGGENLNFRTTWLRPLLVFADNPLLIDPISVMDASLAGKPLAEKTYRAISEGRVAIWLVPRKQAPFNKENWYAPHNPLFPSDFQSLFMSCYTPREHSRYFDLWFWNDLPVAGAAPAGVAVAGSHHSP